MERMAKYQPLDVPIPLSVKPSQRKVGVLIITIRAHKKASQMFKSIYKAISI
jgi:hypothetical protein